MEDFKLKLFRDEYKKDLKYSVLSSIECEKIIRNISVRFNIKLDASIFISELYNKQRYIEDVNARENFSLKTVLNNLCIYPNSKIYVNWYHFDDVNMFNYDDFNIYFYDIWYESSDDIDIFDESIDWILSIRHDGSVSIINHL